MSKAREDRLYKGLTAQERARLAMADLKAGREPSPRVSWLTPDAQREELSRLLGLFARVEEHVAPLLALLERDVRELRVRLGWYLTMLQYGALADEVRWHVNLHCREPVTAEERDRRVAELKAETITAADLAGYLLERDEDETGVELKGAKRKKALAEKKAAIEEALRNGGLEGKRRGRTTDITWGSVYDWLGEGVPVIPERGVSVALVPEADKHLIEHDRQAYGQLMRRLDTAPRFPVRDAAEGEDASDADAAGVALLESLLAGVASISAQLQAVAVVVEDVKRDFEGDDPLFPDTRELVDRLPGEVEELRSHLVGLGHGMPSADADKTLVADLRQRVREGA